MAQYSEKKRAALDAMMREEVYRVAVEILTGEGMGGLTMDRISKEIGVSRGTLYNYFDDRDAVINFVEDETIAPTLEALENLSQGEGPAERKLEAMAAEILHALGQNRALVCVLATREHIEASRQMNQAKHRGHALSILRKVIEQGIQTNQLRSLDAAIVAELFFGAITQIIDTMAYPGLDREPEEILPTLMDVFLLGLRPIRGEQ